MLRPARLYSWPLSAVHLQLFLLVFSRDKLHVLKVRSRTSITIQIAAQGSASRHSLHKDAEGESDKRQTHETA